MTKRQNRHKTKEKAGVVVYRLEPDGEPRILVISARKFKNQWVFPVGSVEKKETLEIAAKRECVEESGYLVEIGEKLPAIQVPDEKATIRFTFFLARVIGEADQWEVDRKRIWVPVSEIVNTMPDVFKAVARMALDYIDHKMESV